jgi:hypothetical protein
MGIFDYILSCHGSKSKMEDKIVAIQLGNAHAC